MLTLWLVRLLALLLASLVMVVHVAAFASLQIVLRVFDGELLGVDSNQAVAIALAVAVTLLQILLPIILVEPDRSLSFRIAVSVLTIVIAAVGWLISAALLPSPAATRYSGLSAGIWLVTETIASVLLALAWLPPAKRRLPQSQATERPADLGPIPPSPSFGAFEQRLLDHLTKACTAAATGGSGGELVTTQASLARQLGCSKSTINAALHALAAGRAIRLQTSARQTHVWLNIREHYRPVADPWTQPVAPVSDTRTTEDPIARSSDAQRRTSFGTEQQYKAADWAALERVDRWIVRLFASVRTSGLARAYMCHLYHQCPRQACTGAS